MWEDLQEILQRYYIELLELLPKLGMAILIMFLAILIAIHLSTFVSRRMKKRLSDPLLSIFLGRMTKWAIVLVGIALALKALGLGAIAGSLIAGAGLTAFIVGFAFKDLGENLLSGVMLAFSRPFNIGDIIEAQNYKGKIVTMTLRNTHIKTGDGRDVYIPNSMMIKNPVVNFTRDGFLRFEFVVGIDVYDDALKAIEIIKERISTIEGVLHDKPPIVAIDELTINAVDIKIRYWIDAFDLRYSGIEVKSKVMHSIYTCLLEQGFSMPNDIKELKIYKEDQPIPIRTIQNNE